MCMQNHANFSSFHINHTHLGSSQTTHKDIFLGPSQLQKLNQFKPVLVSGKILKNLKFPTFCTNLTHFYYEFLKDFIFSESLDPQDHYGTNRYRIHPVFAELGIAPRKQSYDLNFYCIVIYVIHRLII